MRERTTALHAAAEASGVVAALMQGQIGRLCYALYLRNLLPAYQAMEQALRLRQPGLEELAQPYVYRAECIAADLDRLAGADWAACLPVLPAGEQYAARVSWTATGPLLIAHCYTRYLGDLNGGRIMARRLTGLFGADASGLGFTAFPAIDDLSSFTRAYRGALDRAGDQLADPAPVIEEAAVAFRMNIAVSQQVAAFG